MKENPPQRVVFWTLWISLTAFYFYLPVGMNKEIPYRPGHEFDWNYVHTLSIVLFIFSSYIRFRIIPKKSSRKNLLPFYVAGIALVNGFTQFATFLFVGSDMTGNWFVWYLGILGMLLYIPWSISILREGVEPVDGADGTR
jgi:hypothetical protein